MNLCVSNGSELTLAVSAVASGGETIICTACSVAPHLCWDVSGCRHRVSNSHCLFLHACVPHDADNSKTSKPSDASGAIHVCRVALLQGDVSLLTHFGRFELTWPCRKQNCVCHHQIAACLSELVVTGGVFVFVRLLALGTFVGLLCGESWVKAFF